MKGISNTTPIKILEHDICMKYASSLTHPFLYARVVSLLARRITHVLLFHSGLKSTYGSVLDCKPAKVLKEGESGRRKWVSLSENGRVV